MVNYWLTERRILCDAISDKIHLLTTVSKLHLSPISETAFIELKRGLAKAAITLWDHTLLLVVEKDVAEYAVVASLREW